jgi:hypothetical protein
MLTTRQNPTKYGFVHQKLRRHRSREEARGIPAAGENQRWNRQRRVQRWEAAANKLGASPANSWPQTCGGLKFTQTPAGG